MGGLLAGGAGGGDVPAVGGELLDDGVCLVGGPVAEPVVEGCGERGAGGGRGHAEYSWLIQASIREGWLPSARGWPVVRDRHGRPGFAVQ
ncbi:hypothetical protein KCH_15120 [Kitasatospora cheerisanensis KCTC 2395]|uniref:Uncharacterized protein n=1 Tax=Kitasatospora cheerisanensis KCTC 2395 TaxID=1348663 RepID=A0A066Z3C8_9ACTN|nr:hypothetical protein KCH_15120 [Kitasatospora cheerisanensis KCTC 2395]